MNNNISKETTDKMFELARKALQNAYTPYSNFQVGACILTDDDKMFSGCNIENASFGLTNCAERCAINNMIANVGNKTIKAVLVTSSGNFVVTPCGACRQVIREFAAKNAIVFLCDNKKICETITAEELLPKSFGPEFAEEMHE